MSNSLRHQERRRERAKQKSHEGQRGRRINLQRSPKVEGIHGTNFMSKLNAFLFKRHLFRRGQRE